jgi:hypothetical protein
MATSMSFTNNQENDAKRNRFGFSGTREFNATGGSPTNNRRDNSYIGKGISNKNTEK